MPNSTALIEQEVASEVAKQLPQVDPAREQAQPAPADAATAQAGTPAYHERYYLAYHEGKRTTPLDLDGTKAFLQAIGFDGGELRKARLGRCDSEELSLPEKGKANRLSCSYCDSSISGVEFYRLKDNRIRCSACSATLVKTKAEAQELYKRVVSNLESFFGANLDVPVAVEILEENKLKRKMGVPLGTKDGDSILVLGLAVNKKNKYSIYMENGAPRMSMIATFAHELTHIWQYTHWDTKKKFKKCSKGKRLIIYEGMAKWVEIQYLYLIGETNAAKREEEKTRIRNDEYGEGFRLYEQHYPLTRETMNCKQTPFTEEHYPFEDK